MNTDKTSRIFVAGHKGMVGNALVTRLRKKGYENIITRNRSELDLTDSQAVDRFFATESIDTVYLAAAKVGGILANSTFPADFILENLKIQCNIIEQAHKHGVQHLLFLGSSCIYPKLATQPIKESELLNGYLEPTNEPYAVAKIAGIKLCESFNRQYGRDYRSVMPTNLYGENDNFHQDNSHVIPGLISRFHQAKINNAEHVIVWGSGTPRREFLHVEDMADACIHVMNLDRTLFDSKIPPMQSHINVGTGNDVTIEMLAKMIAQVVGFQGNILFDKTKPDGTPRKQLDTSLLQSLSWKPVITLEKGLKRTYRWFLENQNSIRS